MEKNERKLQVLKILCNGGLTSSELAETYGILPVTASCLLANYQHQGLLRRRLRKEPGGAPRGEYYYTIATKGERKIEYLEEVFQPTFVEEAGAFKVLGGEMGLGGSDDRAMEAWLKGKLKQ
ncbi:hypothetical protein ES705_31905 [subsurface metagenome]|jgi:predicted ArsR family transcriptional regulator